MGLTAIQDVTSWMHCLRPCKLNMQTIMLPVEADCRLGSPLPHREARQRTHSCSPCTHLVCSHLQDGPARILPQGPGWPGWRYAMVQNPSHPHLNASHQSHTLSYSGHGGHSMLPGEPHEQVLAFVVIARPCRQPAASSGPSARP
jgi:hypothetical protein